MISSDKGYRIRDALCQRCGHRESSHSTRANDREYRVRAAVRCGVWTAETKQCRCPEFVHADGGEAA